MNRLRPSSLPRSTPRRRPYRLRQRGRQYGADLAEFSANTTPKDNRNAHSAAGLCATSAHGVPTGGMARVIAKVSGYLSSG